VERIGNTYEAGILAVVDGCRVGDVELLVSKFYKISLWMAISEGTLKFITACRDLRASGSRDDSK